MAKFIIFAILFGACSLGVYGSHAWLCFLAFSLSVFFLVIKYWYRNIAFYVLPSVPYLTISATLLLVSGREEAGRVGAMLFLGFWALVAGFYISGMLWRRASDRLCLSSELYERPIFSFPVIVLMLATLNVAAMGLNYLQSTSTAGLAFALIMKQMVSFLLALFTVFLAAYGFRKLLGYLLVICFIFFLRDIGAEEYSRFQYAELFYGFWLLLVFANFFSKFWVLAFFVSGMVILLLLALVDPGRTGGDALILSNVADVVENIDANHKHEPLMFFHNMGLMYLPDLFWPSGSRPKLYNPSAWFLVEVLELDAASYPWGVGVAGVGGAYLQGGWLGIGVIYFFVGLVFGHFMFAYRGFVRLALILYSAANLSFSMFRMDVSFMFGPAFITVPLILISARFLDWWLKVPNRMRRHEIAFDK